MSTWQSVDMTKCRQWQSVDMTKCRHDKVSTWQSVDSDKESTDKLYDKMQNKIGQFVNIFMGYILNSCRLQKCRQMNYKKYNLNFADFMITLFPRRFLLSIKILKFMKY